MNRTGDLLARRMPKLTTAPLRSIPLLSILVISLLFTAAPSAAAESRAPRILIDAGHHNFHTAEGRYAPLVTLLQKSAFTVGSSTSALTPEVLESTDVVVIANALHVSNVDRWQQPVEAAFSAAEIALLADWVADGGSLLLIADHFPFPGAIATLAEAFGFRFVNGFALRSDLASIDVFDIDAGSLKRHEHITGTDLKPPVAQIAAFTGSAFEGPPTAQPLMVLSDVYEMWMPSRAWEFLADTPRRPGGGLLQGATLLHGKGRVAVFAEAAMFTSQTAPEDPQTLIGFNAPNARDNRLFVINLFRWLTSSVNPR